MVVAALLSLLQRQTLLVTLLSLFVFPFLVNYISTIFFYRTFNSKKQGKKPPTIPYHVPGVFHALGLVSLGPQIYFAKLIKEYGGFSPFVIRAGTSAFVIIRDQKQIRNILLSSRQLTSEARRMQVYGHVIGAPHGILGIYRGGGKTTGEKSLVENVQQGLYRKHLTRPSLAANVEIYVTTLSNSLQNKMFQYGTWTQIQDLWSFFQHSITASTIEALFGPALLKQYPRVVRDYWEFEAGNDGFLRKYPRFMIPSAYAARDRLHLKLATWLHRNHSGEEFAKLADDDPICDEFMGSKFIQERDEAFAKSDFQGARAAEILAVIHESNSNLIPSVFWIIVEVLRKPNLVKHLMTAIKQYCPPQTASYDVAAISNIPLIQSIQTEVGRLRMATSTIRTSEVDDFQLDENWVLPRGTPAIIFSHDVAMNTELWTEARPRTVDQPLKDFWAERFLVPENSKSPQTKEGSRQNKDKIESGSFNIDGLEHLDITFGSGHLACPGNHYAKAVQAATLALLLNDFEIELCDPDAVDAAMPVAGDIAYGSIKPLESIAIRIRKRRTGEMS